MRIRDVAALVTGGASGLGAATAKRLAGAGAKVAVVDLNGEGAAAPVWCDLRERYEDCRESCRWLLRRGLITVADCPEVLSVAL